mmetsp:Transcript_28393/g.61710  ORF Transcript_28393/g.61710 Transcript_28393/m.61710 type:complete len:116 (+) Transcript_28393:814-1161(+)
MALVGGDQVATQYGSYRAAIPARTGMRSSSKRSSLAAERSAKWSGGCSRRALDPEVRVHSEARSRMAAHARPALKLPRGDPSTSLRDLGQPLRLQVEPASSTSPLPQQQQQQQQQ